MRISSINQSMNLSGTNQNSLVNKNNNYKNNQNQNKDVSFGTHVENFGDFLDPYIGKIIPVEHPLIKRLADLIADPIKRTTKFEFTDKYKRFGDGTSGEYKGLRINIIPSLEGLSDAELEIYLRLLRKQVPEYGSKANYGILQWEKDFNKTGLQAKTTYSALRDQLRRTHEPFIDMEDKTVIEAADWMHSVLEPQALDKTEATVIDTLHQDYLQELKTKLETVRKKDRRTMHEQEKQKLEQAIAQQQKEARATISAMGII